MEKMSRDTLANPLSSPCDIWWHCSLNNHQECHVLFDWRLTSLRLWGCFISVRMLRFVFGWNSKIFVTKEQGSIVIFYWSRWSSIGALEWSKIVVETIHTLKSAIAWHKNYGPVSAQRNGSKNITVNLSSEESKCKQTYFIQICWKTWTVGVNKKIKKATYFFYTDVLN